MNIIKTRLLGHKVKLHLSNDYFPVQTQPAASLDEKTTFDSGKLAPTVPSVHQQQPMNSQPVSLQPISSHAVHLQVHHIS